MRISSGALLLVILAAPACQQPDFQPQYLQAQAGPSAAQDTEYSDYVGGFGDTALAPPPNPVGDEESLPAADVGEACDPNYRPCVPIASDVDCLGGGGNGPAYVRGPVRVIRRDIYQLDRDGDGIGCDR